MPAVLPLPLRSTHVRGFVLVAMLLSAGALAQETNGEYEERRARQAAGLPPPSRGITDDGSSTDTGGAVYLGHLITFFPPTPPIYGAAPSEPSTRRVTFNGQSLEAPEGLADFVGETFYPVLSSRLFETGGKLGSKLQNRLAAYRSSRAALLDELVGELLRVQAASKTERAQALQAFTPRQAESLAKLEREAEELRRELVKGGWFSGRADWNLYRKWRLGSPEMAAAPIKPEAEFQVARATAYFQEGLSIEQRGLLRELAVELARTARAARAQPVSSEDDPAAMFFSPETARFRVPAQLPREVFAQIGRFNADKTALKRELLEVLVASDELPPEKRTARFTELAFEQAPRIAALERDAEEIRRALDTRPETPPPWLPPIGADLREKIDSYNRDRSAMVASYSAVQFRAAAQSRSRTADMQGAQRQAAQNFEAAHAEEIGALRTRYEQIRRELADVARDLKDPRNNRPLTVDSLLDAHRVAMQRFDAIGREEAMYRYYKIAVMQPGLSPAQRRLLFRAAHANLAQALPIGEILLSSTPRPIPQS